MEDTHPARTIYRALKPVALLAITAVLVFGSLDVLSQITLPKNNMESFGQRDAEARGVLGERKGSIDVLFVGDSEVYTSLSPLQMWKERGFTSYDLSTSAQPISYSLSQLKTALKTQRPDVVVVETNQLFRKPDLEYAIWREIADILPILEYHERWKSLEVHDFNSDPRSTWTDPDKGFRRRDKIVPSSTKGYMIPSDETEEIPALNQRYLDAIVSLCRKHDIQVVLLSTPSTKNWNWKRHNAVEAYLDHMDNASDIRYLDLNLERNAVPIDWSSDSCDGGDHLNVSGARKVSSFVGEWLQKTYNLRDHRSDPDFHAWNEAALRSNAKKSSSATAKRR